LLAYLMSDPMHLMINGEELVKHPDFQMVLLSSDLPLPADLLSRVTIV
jgi:hypothetical protein